MKKTRIKLVADLHVHTVSSGHAYSTIEEYVSAVKRKKLKCFGVTDHGPKMPGGAPLYHFANLGMVPKVVQGIRVLGGAEVNVIGPNGELDVPDHVLKELDYAIVAIHPKCGYEGRSEEENTKTLIKSLDRPGIKIIAHPGNPMYPIDYKKVIPIAKEKGILIELNNSSLTVSRMGSELRCFEIAKFVKSIGWKVSLGSDSHFSTMIGGLDHAAQLAVDAGLKSDDIINTSMELMEEYLLKK